MERTLSIIKPDGVSRGLIGDVVKHIEGRGLKIVAMKMLHLTQAQARGFYAVHRERPFFEGLTTFMSSGPAVVMVLEGDNAIARWRELMGATDYRKAAEGTIRRAVRHRHREERGARVRRPGNRGLRDRVFLQPV